MPDRNTKVSRYMMSSRKIKVEECITSWLSTYGPVLVACKIDDASIATYYTGIYNIYRQQLIKMLVHLNDMTPVLNAYARIRLKIGDSNLYDDNTPDKVFARSLEKLIQEMWFKRPDHKYITASAKHSRTQRKVFKDAAGQSE